MKNTNYVAFDPNGNGFYPDTVLKPIINNPTEEDYKRFVGAVPAVYTEPPKYDPETQYVTDHFEPIDGKAVQVWEVHDIPREEFEEVIE